MEVSVTLDESGVRLGEVTPLFSMSDHEFGDFDVTPYGAKTQPNSNRRYDREFSQVEVGPAA